MVNATLIDIDMSIKGQHKGHTRSYIRTDVYRIEMVINEKKQRLKRGNETENSEKENYTLNKRC